MTPLKTDIKVSPRNQQSECKCINDCPRNLYEMNNESLVFQQNDLFPLAFPCMEEIRRQGKLCDVVLKVVLQYYNILKILV